MTHDIHQLDGLQDAVNACLRSYNLDALRVWVADMPEQEWRLLPVEFQNELFNLLV